MKKIILSAFTLVLFIATANAQSPDIKAGTKLVYHVVTNANQEYDYTITVNDFGPNIAFDWAMGDPVNASGKINITAGALASATSYKNYFGDGSDETLTEQCTVWLSKKNFNDLQNNKKTTMDMTGDQLEFVKGDIPSISAYTMNGATKRASSITCMVATSEGAGYTIRVLDDRKDPLITYMDLGRFSITLKSIE